jgi:uncharacterized protein (TIGR02145 family)
MYLEGSLGMTISQQQIVDAFRGNDQGGALKFIDVWNIPNVGATNTYGFSSLPGGMRANVGFYYGIIGMTSIWTSTAAQSGNAYLRMLTSNSSGVSRNDGAEQNGFSVRCVRD